MNYLDFNEEIKNLNPANLQPLLPQTTTAVAAAAAAAAANNSSIIPNQQQTKDLSDWRNIQLGTSPNLFEPFWFPQAPIVPWNHSIYPPTSQHPYPWTNPNSHQPWKMPMHHTMAPPPPPPLPTVPLSRSSSQNDVILLPELDLDEILNAIESVIPDIDLEYARRTIRTMNPLPSTNDLVSHFLDNGYSKRIKKHFSTDSQKSSSLKRSISDIIEDIPKFLSSYPDPVKFFFDVERKQSDLYVNHAKAYLLRAFPTMDKTFLEKTLEEHNWHFLPTIRKLEAQQRIRVNTFLQRMTSLDMIGEISIRFFFYFENHLFK